MRFLLIALAIVLPFQGSTPEEMYGIYATPETKEILERYEQMEREVQAAEEAARTQKTIALSLSILVGLIPFGVILRRSVRESTWKNNPGGTIAGLLIALLGGALLFGLNYGIFYLRFNTGEQFNIALAFLLVAAMIAGAIFLLLKKDHKNNKS